MKIRTCLVILAVALIVSSCGWRRQGDVTTTETPLSEPVVPAGYLKTPPGPANNSRQMLAQTATIFTGVLKDVRFTYDDCGGPRTSYVFSDSSTLVGTEVQPTITLSVLGGPKPNGAWVEVSELPRLALDSQYVVFLRNTDWTYSPVVGNLVFRREMIGGREVLVDPTGHAVTGWTDDGPTLSAVTVSEAVGRNLKGYRSSESPDRTTDPSSADTDPNPALGPSTGNAPAPAQEGTESTPLARAPSLAEARKAGLFARPELTPTAIANQQVVTAESLVAEVRRAAERAGVNIGGKLTLNPYWRCWSYTPTHKTAR